MSLRQDDPLAARLPRREYGRTGKFLSVIGFGGIIVMDEEPDDAARVVREAVERGVNYFDVAPSYGNAQEKLGPALEPYRDEVFLACKTNERDAKGAARQMEESFRLLRTDTFDLFQLHAITDVAADVEAVFAPGGAWEPIMEAKEAGRIKHLGFSAHSVEAAMAALDRYPFESVLFPVNFATFEKGGFGPALLDRCRRDGVAVLALKAMARQKWTDDHPKRAQYRKAWYEPLDDPALAALALRYTLGKDGVVAALPPGHYELWRMAMDSFAGDAPLSDAELAALRERAAELDPIFEAATA